MTDAAAFGRREVDGWSIRWNAEKAARWSEEGWWLNRTIGDYARDLAEREPGRLLVIDGDTELCAGRLYAAAIRLTDSLRKRGVKRGDVISFMLPNWHESVIIYLAGTLMGAVCHPLVTNYRNAELLFMLGDCKSKVIFIPSIYRGHDYAAMMAEICDEMDQSPLVVVLRGEVGRFESYQALMAEGDERARFDPVDPNAVRLILYTSGTTGRPKGVLHTHNSINADVVQLHRYWNRSTDTRYLVASPVSHIGGSIYAFEMPLIYGTSVVLMDPWDADLAVELIDRLRCTIMAGATPFLDLLLKAARKAGSRLPSLRTFVCGGASVPPSLIQDATEWFEHCTAMRAYGSTEVPTITIGALTPGDIEHAANTDGKIGIASAAVKDPDASGEGEIFATGPQIMVGYFNPEDERTAFDEEGFYKMGDLGRIVDGGYIVITGRTKDVIIRNGENISPKEVEDLLILHPQVMEVAVVGLPSARTGELACAFVVPSAGQQPRVEDFATFLAGQGLAKFKFPERVVLTAELPRNATGKILKNVLQKQYFAAQTEPAACPATRLP